VTSAEFVASEYGATGSAAWAARAAEATEEWLAEAWARAAGGDMGSG